MAGREGGGFLLGGVGQKDRQQPIMLESCVYYTKSSPFGGASLLGIRTLGLGFRGLRFTA